MPIEAGLRSTVLICKPPEEVMGLLWAKARENVLSSWKDPAGESFVSQLHRVCISLLTSGF